MKSAATPHPGACACVFLPTPRPCSSLRCFNVLSIRRTCSAALKRLVATTQRNEPPFQGRWRQPPAWPNSARFATHPAGDAASRRARAPRDPTLSFPRCQGRLTHAQTHALLSLSLSHLICDLQHRDSRRGVPDQIVSRKAPTRLSPERGLRSVYSKVAASEQGALVSRRAVSVRQ